MLTLLPFIMIFIAQWWLMHGTISHFGHSWHIYVLVIVAFISIVSGPGALLACAAGLVFGIFF